MMTQLVSSPPRVYAVVVNWNRPADTVACINSLLTQVGVSFEVIVVDNGSTDDSVFIIREKFPQVELIASPTNLKFARGYNLGMRRALDAGAEYVFIINNDAVIAPNGLATLLLHTGSDIGVVAPIIYHFDYPQRIWSIGGKVHPWTLVNINAARHIRVNGKWPQFFEQDFVTGCGMLFHRNILEVVGLFDEQFEHYYEDYDLCSRIRMAGYRIRVIPQAKMWHKIAVSSGGSDAPDERYWMARSSVRYYCKYGRGWRMLVIVPNQLGLAIKTTIRLLCIGRSRSARSYWHGLLDGLHDL
jgi:GT2 family glycosyltransferase